MNYAAIAGSGSYLPKRSLTNHELEQTLDTSHEWIHTRTGISSRYIAEDEETTSFMAAEAAKLALEASALSAESIDLIIVATCTADFFFPSTACFVKNKLEIQRSIPAFDISVACNGFIYALDVAKQYITSGAAQHILIVGSEKMSCAVDWQDRSTCVLFGDGAGAVILSASDKPGILSSKIHSAYDKDAILTYPNLVIDPNGKLKMRGNEVFKLAVNMMGDIVDEVLAEAQVTKADIDWLIPHQANVRIIKAIAKKLDLPMSQVVVTVEHQGNTSAASIPIALDHAIQNQQIQRGQLLLLEGFGGGITWGAVLVRY